MMCCSLAPQTLGKLFGIAEGAIFPAFDVIKIATEKLQRVALLLNLNPRAHSQTAQQRDRRAPALERVLEKEARDQRR